MKWRLIILGFDAQSLVRPLHVPFIAWTVDKTRAVSDHADLQASCSLVQCAIVIHLD